MQSLYLCFGYLRKDPVQFTTKKGITGAKFNLMIKRNGANIFDIFNFSAYGQNAKYALENFHSGDCISVQSRPMLYDVKDKNGNMTKMITFVVTHADFICKKNRLPLDKFGNSLIEEMEEKFVW